MKKYESASELWKQIVWNNYRKFAPAALSLPQFFALAELTEKADFLRRSGLRRRETASTSPVALPAEPMEHRLCSLFGD